MYNLIGNCCAASFIMVDNDKLNQPLLNPFSYALIDFNSMKYLIENYDNLNLHNYKLIKEDGWKFSIIIENKIKVFYLHYVFNPKVEYYHNKINHNIESNKIWEYIVKKYEERLTRMEKENITPIFVLGSAGNDRNHYSEQQVLELLNMKNDFKIIIAQKEDIKFNCTENREYIKIPNTILTDGTPLASYIYKNSKILK